MVTRIDYRNNKSLSELEIVPGEFMAFNNDDVEYGEHPFLIAMPKRLERGENSCSQKLIFAPTGEDSEFWQLHSENKVIKLWAPVKWNGLSIPNIETNNDYGMNNDSDKSYVVMKAYSGNEAVKQGLIEARLESYCGMFGLD